MTAELMPLSEVRTLAQDFAKSGLFGKIDPSQAIVKILAGQELGLGPFTAMQGIDIIDGKLAFKPVLLLGLIKRTKGHYDYVVIDSTETRCELEAFKDGVSLGRVSYDQEDAKKAGLLGKYNWQHYPEDMYFARCASRMCRRHFPDLSLFPLYTPEGMGSEEMSQDEGLDRVPANDASVSVRDKTAATEEPEQAHGGLHSLPADPRKKAFALFKEIGAPEEDEANRAWISRLLKWPDLKSRSQLTGDHWTRIATEIGLLLSVKRRRNCPLTIQQIFDAKADRPMNLWTQPLEAWSSCSSWLHDWIPDPYADEDNQPVEAEVVEEAAHA